MSWFIFTCQYFSVVSKHIKWAFLTKQIIHELFITGQFITRWFLISLLIQALTSTGCQWSGTRWTAKDSRSYRPYLPIDLWQYGWRTNSRRKAESYVTAVLFSTQVKDNILVLWWIKRILRCITEKMCWKKLIWILSWTMLISVCDAFCFKLGQS